MGVNNSDNEDLVIMKEDEFEVEGDDVPLPGFRFHPTDEELVSFYLRRKLDNKPITIELIKQIDIYKYDPWDLPRASGTGGEKEGYFFCKRGRKYRNSIRPNRVTGSGFWKATGIDKPVYSHGGEGNDCIGLKKTLVYYRGSAGKGTKTDWMMHEFRLPSSSNTTTTNTNLHHHHHADLALQEAEIWTLCRIFKRNVSPRKHTAEMMMRSSSTTTKSSTTHNNKMSSKIISSVDYCNIKNNHESYINFGGSNLFGHHHHQNEEQKPLILNNYNTNNHPLLVPQQSQQQHQVQIITSPPLLSSNNNNNNNNFWINNNHHHAHAAAATNYSDLFTFENWDELGSVVKFAVDSPSL